MPYWLDLAINTYFVFVAILTTAVITWAAMAVYDWMKDDER